MASHAQINKNVRDVNTAWGHLQSFLHSLVPQSASGIHAWANTINIKRRY